MKKSLKYCKQNSEFMSKASLTDVDNVYRTVINFFMHSIDY